MRYKWIDLYGYAGFYNGMGLNQIKIDLTKCKTNKILIRGGNGSGKSTLLEAFNPLPDPNTKFIPNMEARKTICLSDNGIDYIIRYIHPITNNGRGTTKGYISKTINGQLVELNPNGNISSCKDILYEEFNLDSNYIALSRLSSENRGLVDSKPAERKKIVGTIISALETYNGIYKILSKKSSGLEQMINSLSYKIDRIGNEVQLNAKLQNIENRLVTLEQERDTTIEVIATLRLKISEYMNILRDNNYDAIISELKDITTHIKALTNQIIKQSQVFGIDIENLESFKDHIDKQIILYESTISNMSSQVTSLLNQREIESKELQDKQARLDSLQSEYNYLDIKNAMNSLHESVANFEEIFAQMKLVNVNLLTKSEFDSAMEALKNLKEMANIITASYTASDIKYVIHNMDNIVNSMLGIKGNETRLLSLRNDKSELDTNIAVYESKQEIIAELNNRPSDCTIDSCPYIKTALETSRAYPQNSLLKMKELSHSYSVEIASLEKNIAETHYYNSILVMIQNIIRELKSNMKFISKLPVDPDFANTFLDRIVSLDQFHDVDELYKYIDCGNIIEEYKVAKQQLTAYETEYKLYQAKNGIIETIANDIQNLMHRTSDMANEILQLNTEISNKQKDLEDLKAAKMKVETLLSKRKDDLNPAMEREQELIKIKQALDTNSIEANRLQDELNAISSNLGAVNKDIKSLTNERDAIKHSLIQLAEYKADYQQYSESYNKIKKIRFYSSPSTGIQTLFMQLYMNKIITTANELLSSLFEGEFALQPFIINDSEFSIPCLGSGLMHDDISSMSTAQKSIISMILSCSILFQSSTKYNIPSFDEVDGGLDTTNRGYFVGLIDKVMYMLHAEQCFLISHNNELDSSTCDLILLKNAGNETYSGNIIWQY